MSKEKYIMDCCYMCKHYGAETGDEIILPTAEVRGQKIGYKVFPVYNIHLCDLDKQEHPIEHFCRHFEKDTVFSHHLSNSFNREQREKLDYLKLDVEDDFDDFMGE